MRCMVGFRRKLYTASRDGAHQGIQKCYRSHVLTTTEALCRRLISTALPQHYHRSCDRHKSPSVVCNFGSRAWLGTSTNTTAEHSERASHVTWRRGVMGARSSLPLRRRSGPATRRYSTQSRPFRGHLLRRMQHLPQLLSFRRLQAGRKRDATAVARFVLPMCRRSSMPAIASTSHRILPHIQRGSKLYSIYCFDTSHSSCKTYATATNDKHSRKAESKLYALKLWYLESRVCPSTALGTSRMGLGPNSRT